MILIPIPEKLIWSMHAHTLDIYVDDKLYNTLKDNGINYILVSGCPMNIHSKDDYDEDMQFKFSDDEYHIECVDEKSAVFIKMQL